MTAASPAAGRRFAVDALLVGASRTVPVLVPLAFTPFVLAAFGPRIYALWAVLMTVIGILQNADLGVTSVMQRFHSHYRGLGDEASGLRLTSTVLVAVASVAVLLAALSPLVAPIIVAAMHLSPALSADALQLLRPAGLFAGLQLLALALGGYLTGHARFAAAAGTSLAARAALAAVLTVTLVAGLGVLAAVLAVTLDAVLAVLLAGAASARHLASAFRSLLTRAELAEVWSFAWRSQLSTAGFLAQRELDVLLATLLLPLTAVGAVAAAAQSSIAASLFPTILLMPLVTRIGFAAGRDRASGIEVARAADAEWARRYPLYAGAVLGIIGPAVAAWVGPSLPLSPLLAVLIAAGMLAFLPGSVLVLTSRALGRPGVELSAYAALVAVKVVLGVAGALLFGPIGLAASTIAATVAAQLVLARRIRVVDPGLRLRRPPWPTLALAAAACALTATGASVVAALSSSGAVRLVLDAALTVLVLGAAAWADASIHRSKADALR